MESKESISSISIKIKRFYSSIKDYKEGAPNTRYKSWEWCHEAFMEKKDEYLKADDNTQKSIVEYLALHLAFYLASWGMYRGSSFLLQRDYKTHKSAVKYILEEKYKKLWDYNPNEDDDIDETTDLLFSENEAELGIYYRISSAYNFIKEDKDTPTDTLITKILMGTYGCVPAFDRFLKFGIAQYTKCIEKKINGIRLTQSINRNTFQALVHLAINQRGSLIIDNGEGVKYPPMKCLDMYFWEIGFEIDIAKGLIDNENDDTKKKALLTQAAQLNLCQYNLEYEDAYSEIMAKNE